MCLVAKHGGSGGKTVKRISSKLILTYIVRLIPPTLEWEKVGGGKGGKQPNYSTYRL